MDNRRITPKDTEYQIYKKSLLERVSREPKVIWWKPRTWFRKKESDKARIYYGDKVFTMAQLITEIENDTEIGIDHVNMHKGVCEHRKSIEIEKRKEKLIKIIKSKSK